MISKSKWLWPLIGFALVAPAQAQNNHTQLEVVSTVVDLNTRGVTVSLVNRSEKSIVAYVLRVEQFDSAGNLIGTPLNLGTDNVFRLFYGPNPQATIASGADLKRQFPLLPDAVSATASVLSVVYGDRTADGNPDQTALVFKNRGMHAQHAQAAADLLSSYPTTPAGIQSRLSQLNTIHERTGATERLLHGKENAAQQSSNALNANPSREEWAAAAKEQNSLANFLKTQSQEVTK